MNHLLLQWDTLSNPAGSVPAALLNGTQVPFRTEITPQERGGKKKKVTHELLSSPRCHRYEALGETRTVNDGSEKKKKTSQSSESPLREAVRLSMGLWESVFAFVVCHMIRCCLLSWWGRASGRDLGWAGWSGSHAWVEQAFCLQKLLNCSDTVHWQ